MSHLRSLACVAAIVLLSQLAAAQSPAAEKAPAGAPTTSAQSGTGGAPSAGAQAAAGGDAKAGAQKTSMCAGCHGIEGWRTAFPEVYRVPRLGGQHEAYLAKALQEYRAGERRHPSMRAIAESLSDKDIADLAAYYAQSRTQTAGK